MKLETLIKKLNEKKNGAWFKIEWTSDLNGKLCASAKRAGHVVEKEVSTTIRKGIRYANMASVRERLISEGKFLIDPVTGETHVFPEKLSWGEWVDGSDFLIQHKGQYYVRLYTSPNKPKVKYFLDGVLIQAEELKKKGILQPAYWNRENVEECLTLKVFSVNKIY
jgi:hypothetical protein